MILMYFLEPMQSIHLNSIMEGAKGSIQDEIGPDREISARHELVLGGTHLKKKATGAVICKAQSQRSLPGKKS